MVVAREVGKMQVALDNLTEALYKYSASCDGISNVKIQLAKHEVEEKIARMQMVVQKLANQFSVGNINECYERMMKESEGGGNK